MAASDVVLIPRLPCLMLSTLDKFEETKASAIAVTRPGAAQAIPELSEVVR